MSSQQKAFPTGHEAADALRSGFAALSLLPVPWWRDVSAALRAGESPSALLDRILTERCPFEPRKADEINSKAIAALERGSRRGLTAVAWNDAIYPPSLAAIIDPPPLLWARGSLAALGPPAIAIVGSRAASHYALNVAERLAADLAGRGFAVVSGLARGVDSAAHRGALAVDGVTLGVLGCGADIIYPREHASLAREIEGRGLILSELMPGTPPLPWFFPQRNRIISALARAVVIVEAGEKSGSLITARCALEQGRDVLAVPGNVLSGRNRGGHGLLRDGAKIVETADDIIEELGMASPGGKEPQPTRLSELAGGTEPKQASPDSRLLDCLPLGEPCDLDRISEQSGLNPARLLPRLLELELRGFIRRAGAGRFVRFDRTC
jgi:DNA processing protein